MSQSVRPVGWGSYVPTSSLPPGPLPPSRSSSSSCLFRSNRQDPYSGRARAGQLYDNVRSYGANILSSISNQFSGSNMQKHPYFRLLRT